MAYKKSEEKLTDTTANQDFFVNTSAQDDEKFLSETGDVTNTENEVEVKTEINLENPEYEELEAFDDSLDDEVIESADKKQGRKRKGKKKALEFIRDESIFPKTEEEIEDEKEKEEEKKEAEEEAKKTSYQKFLDNIENFLARIQDAEIAEFTAFDDVMKPLFKKDVTRLVCAPAKALTKGDIVVHIKPYENYSVRRFVKSEGEKIYLLGDCEHKYTVIERKHIISKVSAMINGTEYYSFKKKNKSFYRWKKCHFLWLRTLNGEFHTITDEEHELMLQQQLEAQNGEGVVEDNKLINEFIAEPIEDESSAKFEEKEEEEKIKYTGVDMSDIDVAPSVNFDDIALEKQNIAKAREDEKNAVKESIAASDDVVADFSSSSSAKADQSLESTDLAMQDLSEAPVANFNSDDDNKEE